jgi:hypothetical protein
VSNFFGSETAHLAQGEGDLGVGAQRGVATGEDEAQAIIFHGVFVLFSRRVLPN